MDQTQVPCSDSSSNDTGDAIPKTVNVPAKKAGPKFSFSFFLKFKLLNYYPITMAIYYLDPKKERKKERKSQVTFYIFSFTNFLFLIFYLHMALRNRHKSGNLANKRAGILTYQINL